MFHCMSGTDPILFSAQLKVIRSGPVRNSRLLDPFICGHLSVRIVFEGKSSAEDTNSSLGRDVCSLHEKRHRFCARKEITALQFGPGEYEDTASNW
jgi:hypothetical protein